MESVICGQCYLCWYDTIIGGRDSSCWHSIRFAFNAACNADNIIPLWYIAIAVYTSYSNKPCQGSAKEPIVYHNYHSQWHYYRILLSCWQQKPIFYSWPATHSQIADCHFDVTVCWLYHWAWHGQSVVADKSLPRSRRLPLYICAWDSVALRLSLSGVDTWVHTGTLAVV